MKELIQRIEEELADLRQRVKDGNTSEKTLGMIIGLESVKGHIKDILYEEATAE